MTKPIIALIYDFDRTLSTKDMQEYTFIPKLGMSAKQFWEKAKDLKEEHCMDSVLAYMYLMIKEAKSKNVSLEKKEFASLGKSVEFYPGVLDWFDRINEYGKKQGAIVEHYIISSGEREIIEGSKIGKKFARIYASEFLYDASKVAVWPKLAVNYTGKTQFLFRINKGVLDVFNDDKINDYTPENKRRIPFSNMIYIADGMTDVPCMKLVKSNGGKSIAVYKKNSTKSKDVASKLLTDQRADFMAVADYSSGKELEKIAHDIIDDMVANNKLVARHLNNIKLAAKAINGKEYKAKARAEKKTKKAELKETLNKTEENNVV